MAIRHLKKDEKGFTLIELLVVIAIIALLAAIVLVALNNARQKGRDGNRIENIEQMSKAMELFFNTALSYPTSSTAVGSYCIIGSSGCLTNMVPSYMAKLPIAPVPADGTACIANYANATGNDFQLAGTGAAT